MLLYVYYFSNNKDIIIWGLGYFIATKKDINKDKIHEINN